MLYRFKSCHDKKCLAFMNTSSKLLMKLFQTLSVKIYCCWYQALLLCIWQLKFSVLEFPAVTICNQNQFRMDRAPEDLRELMDEFLASKRADMFGGKDRLKQFEQREYQFLTFSIYQIISQPLTHKSFFHQQLCCDKGVLIMYKKTFWIKMNGNTFSSFIDLYFSIYLGAYGAWPPPPPPPPG